MKNQVIAIDGTSSTGKSTIAKAIAKHLGILHIDSGAMYRAVTWFAIENQLYNNDYLDKQKLISSLPRVSVSFRLNKQNQKIETYLNEANIEKEIRNVEVTKKVSFVASIKEVRSHLIHIQQSFLNTHSVVMDGRDIGTTVFPHADVKLFISSSLDVRSKRRYDEMLNNGVNITLDEVKNDLELRDEMDINRADSPLKKADDAIEIDNSFLTEEETIKIAIQIIEEKIKS